MCDLIMKGIVIGGFNHLIVISQAQEGLMYVTGNMFHTTVGSEVHFAA